MVEAGPSLTDRAGCGAEIRGGSRSGSARPTHRAARAPEVHVATYHEEGVSCGGDHVNKSQVSDAHPTNADLMMWMARPSCETRLRLDRRGARRGATQVTASRRPAPPTSVGATSLSPMSETPSVDAMKLA